MKYFPIALLIMICGSAFGQNPMVHFPSICSDGSQIAFSYQGDIWTVAANGGRPYRLTIHEAYEHTPIWSADSEQIIFTGNRYGNDDVYAIPSKGGYPKRLTYHSSFDQAYSIDTKGEILFGTNRLYRQVEWDFEIGKVSASGGTPERAMDAMGSNPEKSPNGQFIAYVMGSCKISREAYVGPANRNVWVYDTKTDAYYQITDNLGNDFMPHWLGNDKLCFISSVSGRYNVYQIAIGAEGKPTGKPTAVTKYSDTGIMHYSVSDQGQIVFSKGDKTLTGSIASGSFSELKLDIPADYRFDPIERKTFTNRISEYALSPNGKLTAMVIRGEVFVKENNSKKSSTKKLTSTPARERDIAWLSDSTLLYLSDRDGQNDIYLIKSTDPEQTNLFKTLKREEIRLTKTKEEESNLVISPDGKRVAYGQGRGKLLVADIAADGKLSKTLTMVDGWDSPSDISWSPDCQWLAYSMSDLNFNDEIFIHKADNTQKPVNVSMHPKGDYEPFWSPDGSKLCFTSVRSNGDADIWFVWLQKSDWEKTKQDWDESSDEQTDEKKEEGEVTVAIDFEDIHERLVQVTSLPGNESGAVTSPDGNTFYFVAYQGWRFDWKTAKVDLFKINWDGKELKQITKGGANPNATLTNNGNVYYLSKGKLSQVDGKSDKTTALPFTAKMTIDHVRERDQIIEQAWRELNAGFYDPDFHGQDWKALKDKYKPWALKASTVQDFRRIANDMLGQLNASHMGLRNGENPEKLQRERTGLIGIEVKKRKTGVEITYILPRSPADKSASKMAVGDIILSVNGEAVTDQTNFYSFLIDQANQKVVLEVKSGAETREVIIRPTTSLYWDEYHAWVKERKALTEKYSNGKLGYIHIQGMNWASFERFERELMAAGHGKEGIVIDVRYNGGGWTTDYLMAVLNVKQHAFTIPRGAAKNLESEKAKFRETYPYGERLPLASWTKPSIAMCNESSYSNAEIFSHAFKTLGLGKLVGKPTFGAVISTGSAGLIDGSYVRMPFRGWYVKSTNQNMEGGPAEPTHDIANPPDYRAKQNDVQLKKAVELLLQDL